MRSRYTAYAKCLDSYLLHSWHPDTRPAVLTLGQMPRWLGLTIVATSEGGPDDDRGTVEFVARHERGELHEVSEFVRLGAEDDRRWVYVGESRS